MSEKSDALRLLDGLENGTQFGIDASLLAERIDPVLFYIVVRFLRESYPASDPAANAVLGRVVKLTSRQAALVRKFSEGEQDPISQWFGSEHSFREFRGRGRELIDTVVDKLDS